MENEKKVVKLAEEQLEQVAGGITDPKEEKKRKRKSLPMMKKTKKRNAITPDVIRRIDECFVTPSYTGGTTR